MASPCLVLQPQTVKNYAHLITLPDGYDTVLEEEASNISAGQKQLITIARVFLADPSILIPDEATSNVDTRTEVLIQQAMARLYTARRGRFPQDSRTPRGTGSPRRSRRRSMSRRRLRRASASRRSSCPER